MEDFLIQHKKHLAKKSRGAIAPNVCLQSVCNAVTMSFADGLNKEGDLFLNLMTSGISKLERSSAN